jgi:hypothetical protein
MKTVMQPAVCFALADIQSEEEFTRTLERALHMKYDFEKLASVSNPRWWGGWGVAIVLGENAYFIGYRRGKQKLRRLYVGDISDNTSLWDLVGLARWLKGTHSTKNSSELKSVCREIHAFLNETPMVCKIYGWYLKGIWSYTPFVATPDELPIGS